MSGIERRELVCENTSGEKIWSLVWLPSAAAGGARCPVVIFAHAMNSNHLSGNAWASGLADKGYAVCCPDLRGARQSLSDGTPDEMTLTGEVADIEAVRDEISRQAFADANNVFLMGASLGGAASALAAAASPGLTKGLILLYPAFSLADEVMRQFPDPVTIPERATLGEGRIANAKETLGEVGGAFLRELVGMDIIGRASAYAGPVLIIHGTSDEIVEPSWSVRAARAYPHATLELVSGEGHAFAGGALKFALKKVVGFLDEECDLADESGLDGDLNAGGAGALGGLGAMGL